MCLAGLENLARIARAEFVDEVILAIPDRRDLANAGDPRGAPQPVEHRAVPDLYDFGWDPHGGSRTRAAGAGVFR